MTDTELVRMSRGMLAMRCESLEIEVARLQAIVDRLPKTADGVPVAYGQYLWYWNDSDELCSLKHERGMSYWDIATDCYSTREAAEAARASQLISNDLARRTTGNDGTPHSGETTPAR